MGKERVLLQNLFWGSTLFVCGILEIGNGYGGLFDLHR